MSATLVALLKEVRECCFFADDNGGIGISEDVVISSALFDKINTAIETAVVFKERTLDHNYLPDYVLDYYGGPRVMQFTKVAHNAYTVKGGPQPPRTFSAANATHARKLVCEYVRQQPLSIG